MASIRDNDLLDKWLLCEFGVDQQTYRDALEEIQELRDDVGKDAERLEEAETLVGDLTDRLSDIVVNFGEKANGVAELSAAFDKLYKLFNPEGN